jgi:succinyl-diaminopimelate desuccinylase
VTDEFDADAVVALTAQLVRLRTVNGSVSTSKSNPSGADTSPTNASSAGTSSDTSGGATGVEAPAASLVADVMRGFGSDVTVTDVAPGRPSVVAVVRGNGPGRTLMFEGHVDVVTEGDPADWSFDAFGGEVVAGRLRGRGSADMKSGVAAMILATRAVELGGFSGTIVVGVLADEEGMMLGAKCFAADLNAGAIPGLTSGIDGVIVCEPEGGEVCPVAKGAIRMTVRFVGAMAHGAMPKMGRNPLPALGSLLIALPEVERGYQQQVGAHESLGDFSLTPTVLAGGTLEQINVIPASAVLALDVRTLPGIDHPGLITLITRLAQQIAAEHNLAAEVTVLDDRPPVDTPPDSAVVLAMLAGHHAATGEEAPLGGVPGTTDGTILTRDAGLPTVVYGPGGKWIAHQVDEFVEVADIETCTRAYIAAARHFLRADSHPAVRASRTDGDSVSSRPADDPAAAG